MVDAVEEGEWELAAQFAEDLLTWLDKDGFPPKITGIPAFDLICARKTAVAVKDWDVIFT